MPCASGIQTRSGNLVLDHYGQRSSKWDIYYFCSELSVLHATDFQDYNAWTRQLKVWAFHSADADPGTYRLALYVAIHLLFPLLLAEILLSQAEKLLPFLTPLSLAQDYSTHTHICTHRS